MDRRTISPSTERRYAAIAASLEGAGVKASTMFGMPTLKLDGKAIGGLYGDAMTFKLSGAAHADALAIPGATLFDPSGMGRPMKAWIIVPVAQADQWERLAQAALASIDA